MAQHMMFLFPGVGSHHTGMGKSFYERFQPVRDLFEEASDVLHVDMRRLCFSPEEMRELDRLENAQTALLCVSVATYRALVTETGREQAVYLGYSLGEYSALCCAGSLALRDALLLVRDRGKIVTEVSASVQGSMSWVVNIVAERVEQICEELRQAGEAVFISAYDTPVKTSISGTLSALRAAGERIVALGGIPIPIKMSGPFHSPLMQPAADRFQELLTTYAYQAPRFPVLSNRTAQPYGSAEDILPNLTLQLVNPIRWRDSLLTAAGYGVTMSIEIGPKNVLTYLLGKTLPDLSNHTLETVEALVAYKENLEQEPVVYPQFLSKCLTTIVGTKNTSDDLQVYQEKVVGAFHQLQATYEELCAGRLVPDTSLSRKAIALVTEALRAKGLSQAEVDRRVAKILS